MYSSMHREGGGVSAEEHPGMHIPLWTEFLTHDCENNTYPQLRLRTVNIVRPRVVVHVLGQFDATLQADLR